MSVHNFEALKFQNNNSKCPVDQSVWLVSLIFVKSSHKEELVAHNTFLVKENQMSGWYLDIFLFQHVVQYPL